jgi:hypothetical protein
VQQEEEKRNIEARMTAERVREVTLIEAEMNAKKDQTEKVVASEAQKEVERNLAEAQKIKTITSSEAAREAALRDAERIQTTADAEAKVADKRRHAAEQEAEGTAAREAAKGLAEAKVTMAKAGARKSEAIAIKEVGLAEAEVLKAKGVVQAENTQTQAEAEAEGTKERELAIATGIEARGGAEAKAIQQKADAMKLFHEAGKEHEEFKLRLQKERDVEMAAIHVQRDVAQANAQVVSEALKHAKIDIVGGENDFFEKVVRSIGTGKSVDRMVQNSATLTDIKETFFNGDPEHFKGQVRQWVADFGIKSEDLKNLTLAALLGKLIASAEDASVKSTIQSALALVKEKGLGQVKAHSVVGGA